MYSKAPSNPFTIFKKRVSSKSKSEFREIAFGIFLKQFKDVWAPLVGSHEIFASDLDLPLIVRRRTDLPCRRTEALMPGRGL